MLDKTLCGMAAVGGISHLMANGFSKAAGIPLRFVPYKRASRRYPKTSLAAKS